MTLKTFIIPHSQTIFAYGIVRKSYQMSNAKLYDYRKKVNMCIILQK